MSKIGIHNSQYGNGVEYLRYAVSKGITIPFFKSVNHGGNIVEAKKVSPQTKTIWRIYRDPDLDGRDLDKTEDIESIANARVIEILENSSREERLATDFFAVHNENHPKTKAGWIRLAELMKLFILKLAPYDIKVNIFDLNCGTPEWWEMQWVMDTGVFELAKRYGAIVGLHEGALSMENTPPDADALWGMNGRIPGSPFVAGGGLLSFRYRFWLDMARRRGIEFPDIVLSEFYPTVVFPLNKLSIENVVNIYRRVDTELAKDKEVKAVLPFTIGGPGWENQQHGFCFHAIIDSMDDKPQPSPHAKIKPTYKNIRNRPDLKADLVNIAVGGQEVTILETQGFWRRVRYTVEGWTHKDNLT